MQLTRGQKDAIQRKAMAIVNEKIEKRKAELIKDYKPSEKAKNILTRVKKIMDARDKYLKLVEELGFKNIYYGAECPEDSGFSFTICLRDDSTKFNEIEQKVRNHELNEITKNEHYPDEVEVMDEIELLNITKDFDVEKFLEKYKNL